MIAFNLDYARLTSYARETEGKIEFYCPTCKVASENETVRKPVFVLPLECAKFQGNISDEFNRNSASISKEPVMSARRTESYNRVSLGILATSAKRKFRAPHNTCLTWLTRNMWAVKIIPIQAWQSVFWKIKNLSIIFIQAVKSKHNCFRFSQINPFYCYRKFLRALVWE